MQTFLPYPSFEDSAKVLDFRRLCKQRSEGKTILNTLINGGGWRHHPAVKMWRGFEDALRLYTNVIIDEWVSRGYKNNMPLYPLPAVVEMPPWLGDERLHSTHRARLLAKLPDHYEQFGWEERPRTTEEGYWWPV